MSIIEIWTCALLQPTTLKKKNTVELKKNQKIIDPASGIELGTLIKICSGKFNYPVIFPQHYQLLLCKFINWNLINNTTRARILRVQNVPLHRAEKMHQNFKNNLKMTNFFLVRFWNGCAENNHKSLKLMKSTEAKLSERTKADFGANFHEANVKKKIVS